MFIARVLRRAFTQHFIDSQKLEQEFVKFIASRTTDMERLAIEVVLDKLEDSEDPHALYETLSDAEKETYEKFQRINTEFEGSLEKKHEK